MSAPRLLTQSEWDRIADLLGEGKTPAEIDRFMPGAPWDLIDAACAELRKIMNEAA